MHDNKVSENAIWEGSITPDNDTPSIGSQMQSQPQMMFCYKCNNVIPGDSKFCPCCKIELYTVCPNCGAKYSSQYQICNQCGTDRLEYLQLQREEQERIEKIKREERIRQEKLERERQEVERKQKEAAAERERQENLRRYEQQENERKQKEAYLKENDEIKETNEYKTTYSLLIEASNAFDKKCRKRTICAITTYIVGYILLVYCLMNEKDLIYEMVAILKLDLEQFVFGYIILAAIFGGILKYMKSDTKLRDFLLWYISSKTDNNKELTTTKLIQVLKYQRKYALSDCCIIAYREEHGLTVNYKWHSWR